MTMPEPEDDRVTTVSIAESPRRRVQSEREDSGIAAEAPADND